MLGKFDCSLIQHANAAILTIGSGMVMDVCELCACTPRVRYWWVRGTQGTALRTFSRSSMLRRSTNFDPRVTFCIAALLLPLP